MLVVRPLAAGVDRRRQAQHRLWHRLRASVLDRGRPESAVV